jgi:hypothetical protein
MLWYTICGIAIQTYRYATQTKSYWKICHQVLENTESIIIDVSLSSSVWEYFLICLSNSFPVYQFLESKSSSSNLIIPFPAGREKTPQVSQISRLGTISPAPISQDSSEPHNQSSQGPGQDIWLTNPALGMTSKCGWSDYWTLIRNPTHFW